ncbi:MAG: hypothetical protein KME60_22090 [Cyanomargarita calcarea GSE-NOS-MK-12-04C]|jgi:hypothetical protein|uniref:Uncharacterized protein n=1 Tax=Cyanomargarita calcarea GSE-NOS-MK-12-04C TaxID=2839659 RepID=A0A951QPA3_9CYAN|nr:hypothetical protein [Cyanomargarita calcarea GSE-NOS-MK-12-04C]
MKPVPVETTDGVKVEINPDAISEIVEVEKEKPGFLWFGGKEAEYEIHMVDGTTFRVEQNEHDKLKETD